jgi:hypothetical protein
MFLSLFKAPFAFLAAIVHAWDARLDVGLEDGWDWADPESWDA